jgi:murein DD-endopeptidase / murein LD-carboxypeptidase
MPDDFAKAFVAAARSCVGARFRLQGRDPATGLDCIGLVVWSAQQCGVSVPDASDYLLADNPARLDAAIAASPLELIDRRALALGDLVRLMSGSQPLHLAVYGADSLIHADLRLRKVVEHRLTPDWVEHIVAAYRFKR